MSRTKASTHGGGKTAGKRLSAPVAGGNTTVIRKTSSRTHINSNNARLSLDGVVAARSERRARAPRDTREGTPGQTRPDFRISTSSHKVSAQGSKRLLLRQAAHQDSQSESESEADDENPEGQEEADTGGEPNAAKEPDAEDDYINDDRIQVVHGPDDSTRPVVSGDLSRNNSCIIEYGEEYRPFINPGNVHKVSIKDKIVGTIVRGSKELKVAFEIGQIIRVLPNELYLTRHQVQDGSTDILSDADWWYAEIVGCCELGQDQRKIAFLKVRWYYTPEHITSRSYGIPSFRDDRIWGPRFRNYKCSPGEFILSDHADYITMDSFSAFADHIFHHLELKGLEIPDYVRVLSAQAQARWQRERSKRDGSVWVKNWALTVAKKGKPSLKQIEENSVNSSDGKSRGRGKAVHKEKLAALA